MNTKDIEKVQENQRRCEQLWADYEPDVRRYCTTMLSSNLDFVDDAVADVFEAVCENIFNGAVVTHPYAWILKITHNIVAKYYKFIKERKDTLVSIDEQIHTVPYIGDDIIEAVLLKNNADIILREKVWESLNDDERCVIELSYSKHMSLVEVAEHIGKSYTATKQQKYRATKKIIEAAKDALENFL